MNQHYDQKAAINSLITLRQERRETQDGVLDLVDMFNNEPSYSAVQAAEGGWRLVEGSTNDVHTAEETVVTFQGIICRMDLPPFEEKISAGSKQLRFLRQSLSLTALGSTIYDKFTENIAAVHGIFGRVVGVKKLQACSIFTSSDDMFEIELANRYFTPKSEARSAQAVELSTDIDPRGYLSMAAGSDYVHTQDNNVLYYKRTEAKSEGHRDYIYMPPVAFQIGDIVEVQASFSMYPLREGKFKTALVLRSILLLDNSHTDNAAILQTSSAIKKKDIRPVVLKRRVGYASSAELSATRAKLQRMQIDSSAGAKSSTENLD